MRHLCCLCCSQDTLQPYVFCVGDAQFKEYDDDSESDSLHFAEDGDKGEEVGSDRWDSQTFYSVLNRGS